MAARQILVPFNFNRNEVQNAILHLLSTAPASPTEGMHYYDTVAKKWNYYNGTGWIDPTARANHTGTQAWSTLTSTPTTLAGYGITDAQTASAQLTALAALATTGLIVRTGTNTFAARTLASTTAALVVTNGDGIAGAPSLAISDVVAGGASGLLSGADKTKLNGIATGATANSTDAQLRDRSTHTGTQGWGTITGTPTTLAGYGISDGATQAYVDSAMSAAANVSVIKGSVRAVVGSTVNIASPGATLDGLTAVNGDIFLLTAQSTGSQNGPYVFNGSAANMTRATNWDVSGEAVLGSYWIVREGTYADKFALLSNDTFTLGTTTATFVYTQSNNAYSAGTGLTLGGTVFSIDTGVVARKVSADLGNNSATSFAVTHGLGNRWVNAQVFDGSTGAQVECDVALTSTTVTTFIFATAPTTNQYKAVITG